MWYLDGNSVQTGGNTYSLTDIRANHTIEVTFKMQVTISGTITYTGAGIADVNMAGLGVVTDANGFYTAKVDYNWNGVVTPEKASYAFEPNSRSYTNVTTNLTEQNYTALLADDLDKNGYVDMNDFAIFCENWLSTGQGDFDNNGIVDFLDFAEFGLAW
jgi:hypothetical protein